MRRYWSLWWTFLKMSWMADLEYRLNISIRVIGEFSWYVMQLSVFEVLYLHTRTISGWDIHGMRVFMGCLFLADVLYMILLAENMDGFSSLVKRGDLDLYLAKPVNSQFMVSCRKVSTAYVLNLLLIASYLIWAIVHLPQSLSAAQLLAFGFLVLCGFVILFALRFMFATLNVILQDAGNLQFVWHQLWRLGTRPDPIYPFYLRVFVMTAFPVAFFASVPARALVEGVSVAFLILAPIFAAFALWLSHFFWGKALRRYSSASS